MIHTRYLKTSKNQALLAEETNNVQEKGNHKGKEKNNSDFNPKEKKNPSEGTSSSKEEKHMKFYKSKCSYCKRGFHLENQCMQKNIEQMFKLLEKNNISLPHGAKRSKDGNQTEEHELCHALKA